jgi:hypothetical protein
MDFNTYLASYRESVKGDLLDGTVAYVQTTPTSMPEKYPKISDYLKYLLDAAQAAAAAGDHVRFGDALTKHRGVVTSAQCAVRRGTNTSSFTQNLSTSH